MHIAGEKLQLFLKLVTLADNSSLHKYFTSFRVEGFFICFVYIIEKII